jgi:uncharacterized protein YlxW (UPF0749 family)
MARFPIPFTLPGLHEGRAPSIPRPSTAMIVLSFCLMLVGLVGGLALSLQWQPRSGAPASTRPGGDKVVVGQTITRLETEQSDLKRQISDLRDQLSRMQADAADKKANLADINAALTREKITAGLVSLEGPGVIATYRDSTSPIAPNDDPANYILHDYDLRDVINTLWAAGAEAISINGERIMANTQLYCVGATVICNATRLSPPFVISAIGNSDDLEAALLGSPQVQPLNQRALVYDIGVEIRKEAKVPVAAYSGSYIFRFAQTDDSTTP